MNRIWFQIFLIVFGVNNLKAQLNNRAEFKIQIPDSSTKNFFNRHSKVDYVLIRFDKGKPAWVGVYYFKSSTDVKDRVVESYNADFEGHLYNLKKKYPHLSLQKHADLTVQQLSGIEKLSDSNTLYTLSTTLRRDSASYDFIFYTISGKIYPGPPTKGGRAALKGDISELQQKFNNSYKSWKPIVVSDSVLFIKGIVEKNGSLGNLKLEHGAQSQFSEKAIEFIKREATTWWPANSGRLIQYQVTFFVKLNKDGSITFDAL